MVRWWDGGWGDGGMVGCWESNGGWWDGGVVESWDDGTVGWWDCGMGAVGWWVGWRDKSMMGW